MTDYPRDAAAGVRKTPRHEIAGWDGGGAAGAMRRVFPALGLLARLQQQVERAVDAGDHAGGDAGVARRRIELVMAQRTRVTLITFLRY